MQETTQLVNNHIPPMSRYRLHGFGVVTGLLSAGTAMVTQAPLNSDGSNCDAIKYTLVALGAISFAASLLYGFTQAIPSCQVYSQSSEDEIERKTNRVNCSFASIYATASIALSIYAFAIGIEADCSIY